MTAMRAGVVAAVTLLAACATPPAETPSVAEVDLPAGEAVGAIAADWWRAFNDSRLDALVDEALRDNRDLARAMARIDESRALLRLARADRSPSVSAGATAGRRRLSETGVQPLGGASPWSNDFRASVDIGYELDLWGRVAAAGRAAREELLATRHARDAVRNSLVGQVVQAYAALRSLDSQLALFRRAVQAQRDGLALQRIRFDAGDLSELDIRQLEAELAANEAQIPRLERSIGETERSLALLLGRSPRGVVAQDIGRSGSEPQPGIAGGVPAGLPSNLLERRPDIRQAEARLRAAGARVEVARAAYLPSIALTTSLGRESADLSDLLEARSTVFSLLASLTQPIWNAGRLDANRDAVIARQRQAELDYRDTVAAAFREVRDALAAHTETQASLRLTEQRARVLARASELTTLRLEGGIASRLDAIEAERAALSAQAQLADARRAVTAAQADVFRSFGAGWAAQAGDNERD